MYNSLCKEAPFKLHPKSPAPEKRRRFDLNSGIYLKPRGLPGGLSILLSSVIAWPTLANW